MISTVVYQSNTRSLKIAREYTALRGKRSGGRHAESIGEGLDAKRKLHSQVPLVVYSRVTPSVLICANPS